MPLNKLDNFLKNIEGRILYVNPNDLDATDAITNQGNSLAQPFKTIQRALLEAARFSYVAGAGNDFVEKTTILLFPGEHLVDNRPGWAIYNNNGAKVVSRSGSESIASSVLSLGLDSVFDLTQEDNILYKFNSYYGGVIVPRGTSIVGLDLRKTKIRPKYVPNPTDPNVSNSSIFKITGACYFWQFSFFDGNKNTPVYTHPDIVTSDYQSIPNFSHHKLSCFEFCDGVNKVGTYGLTDLDMYYSKVSNAYNSYREIGEKFPLSLDGFAKKNSEWEIVGAFASDPISIQSIISGNGSSATSVITVTTEEPHNLNAGTPIKIKGVTGSGVTFPYNISTTVQNVLSSTSFTYLLPAISSYPNINASPDAGAATVIVEVDTVSGASPYIFNISLRSVWGMNGLHADGSKASGFKSTVVAQFTGVSLQKDDRAFVKYNKSTRNYDVVPYTTVYGANLTQGASQTDSAKVYHLDPDAIYRSGWESSHIKLTNDAFIQVVSVFAIGYAKHFDAESGGDASITNSNSNFGQISLNSSGFKKEAFDKDNKGFITSIITPREITSEEENIEWLSLDVGLTTSVGISSHLYLYGFTSSDTAPSSQTQGYRIGARLNDKLYVTLGTGTSEASIYMCDNAIAPTGLTTALGTTSSVKSYDVTSGPTSNSFTIGANTLLTGEKVKIISDDGDLPENIDAHKTYYIINNGDNSTVKLASSYTNAIQEQEITVYGGTNLHILSRVSDKDSGDLGSPIQFDPQNNNWFIHVNTNNQIYNALSTGGVTVYGETTDIAYVSRVSDERSLDEKLYKFRVVIPKELSNGKPPETGFVIQESSTTGVGSSEEFTRVSIGNTDYDYNKNPRFISTCSVSSNVVTVISELPHNLQVNDVVVIRNVKCTTNTTGVENSGYNGRFVVSNVDNALTFRYSVVDTSGITHSPGTFTSNVTVRDESLPRFERNDLQSNLFIYRSEVISPYIEGTQDGIYHLYVLNANNNITDHFTSLKYGQLPADLYPQLDRDNIDSNPPSAKTFAKRSPIGAVVTNDLKKSITRETVDLALKTLGIGLPISSVAGSTITFSRFHGLSGIVTGTITAGSGYNNGTYANVKLLNTSQTGTWNGATANVVVSGAGNSITSVQIVSPGSGYSAGTTLYFDQTRIGAGNNDASYSVVGITTGVNSVLQVTGDGTTSDGYYRISSIPSSTSVTIATGTGDPAVTTDQYGLVVGPAVTITTTTYTSSSGITAFVTSSPHGLLSGNKFKVVNSSNLNLGNYTVHNVTSNTAFTAITNTSISAVNGYILKHGLSANDASSDIRGENFGVRNVTFYNNDTFTLTSELLAGSSDESIINISSGIGTEQRLTLGSYIQIGDEIMRVKSSNNTTSATVIRAVFGTSQKTHSSGSLIRKIKPLAVELRRPSILRASGQTFEYLGYGPGNYSTALPQVQVKTLNDEENFLAQSQERSCGTVVYTGMNNNGDFFNGNTKTSSSSGETISFDIPKPTVTGEDASKLSVVFDEVTVKERLLVEGGKSKSVLSQFDGPVTFNGELRIKSKVSFSGQLRINNITNIDVNSSSPALKIAQRGSGPAIRVDDKEDDTSPFIVTSTGKVGIGTTIPQAKLRVIETGSADAFRVDDNNNDSTPFVINSSGRTGIGTTNPVTRLHVVGVTSSTSFYGNGVIPVGGIIMWSGTIAQLSTNPALSNWRLCDGNNGTPDLRSKFVVGATSDASPGVTFNANDGTVSGSYAPGNTGGEVAHQLTVDEMPSHTHRFSQTNEGVNSGSATVMDGPSAGTAFSPETVGGNDYHENRPPYYALAFIMRVS